MDFKVPIVPRVCEHMFNSRDGRMTETLLRTSTRKRKGQSLRQSFGIA